MPDNPIILRAIDFIETNLLASVTVADMAESVSYSLYHFCRIFNQVTHLTPYDYLIRRRLTKSIDPLLNSNRKILDIALEFQFSNPETFSRAFRRLVGILPSELRKGDQFDQRRLMPRWTYSHLKHISKCPNLLLKIEQWEPFQVIGLMTLVEKDLSVIPELWHRFMDEFQPMANRSTPTYFLGISFYSGEGPPGEFLYMSGVKFEGLEEVVGALVVKEIPAMKVAQFLHRGTLPEQQLTLDYAYNAWLPRSGRQLSKPWVIETIQGDVWQFEDEESETILCVPII